MSRNSAELPTSDFRLSTFVPLAAAVLTCIVLAVGYRFADQTRHHRPPPPPPAAVSWPGTTALTGTLTAYSQRVMSLRTEQGAFAIILALSTAEVPTCRGSPTLRPGERLEVLVPAQGDGSLLAAMVKDGAPCPRA
jgi:hypothetical protein